MFLLIFCLNYLNISFNCSITFYIAQNVEKIPLNHNFVYTLTAFIAALKSKNFFFTN